MDPRQPSPAAVWRLAHSRTLTLDRPRVLAILNCTPDSFFDGGRIPNLGSAMAVAQRAIDAGADMLDIGGESTRPGAERVPAEEQIRRTIPLISTIRGQPGSVGHIPISIDTTSADVAREAIQAGADVINDVSAGEEDPRILILAAEHSAGFILMHRLRPPGEDAYSDRYASPPVYADVVADVAQYLASRAAHAIRAGIPSEAIAIDPGLGFGKTVEQNLQLVRRTGELCALGFAVVSAASRKSFVGRAQGLTDSTPADRLAGSLAFSVAHYGAGARLFRVHDVAEQVAALRAAHAVASGRETTPVGGGRRAP
jgi:dihydropteroate synthase